MDVCHGMDRMSLNPFDNVTYCSAGRDFVGDE